MSVQLIVYPQSFEGQYNEISSSPTEFLVNGINFANLGSTPTYSSPVAIPYFDTLNNAPPSIVNSWYRFRRTANAPDFPSSLGGNLILKSVAGGGSFAGVYQRLSNLVIGNQYTITINLNAATTGFIITQIANGTNIYSGISTSASSTQIIDTFTAQSTDTTVMIIYFNTVTDTATITDISIQPVVGAIPSGATNVLDNGQVIVDLYEDEDIPLSLSVDDFKNVAEQVQSYSKAFNLPATKRNNRIFDQIFEITRSYDGVIFNPYRRTQCVLKQDGFILFEGYLRMLDVTDKEGEISYNVNLYSEVIAIADILQDRSFRDLDFTELEHDYNKTNIKRSWNDVGNSIVYTNPSTSGFRDAYTTLRYPFVNWNGNLLLANGSTGSNATLNNPELTSLEQAFRPFINIKYIIDRIFEATDFTYSSAFFNEADFLKLYMDFNWGSNNSPVQSVSTAANTFFCTNGQGIHYAGTSYTNFVLDNTGLVNFAYPPNYNSATNIITATAINETYNIDYDYRVTNTDSVTRTIECRYLKNSTEINYSGVITLAAGASFVYQGNINASLNTGDTLQAQFKASSSGVVQQSIGGGGGGGFSFGTNVTFILGLTNITTDTILQTLRGETGQWDFLKGLITMFNLVTIPDEDNPNNIKIEPYADVFINSDDSIQLNWTEKIDVSQMKLTPLIDLNRKTMFKFVEDDDDSAFNQYKNQVGGHLYGSQLFNASNEFNILDGEEEIIAEPFAATVVKPLADNFPQFITPAIYAMNDDGISEGFENSPRIMYNNGVKPTGASYFIPAQNGLSSENQTNFLQFSHLSSIPSNSSDLDFHFGICQLIEGVGNPTTQNLFNLYWLPYLGELYNPDTRIMTIKVNLSPADINTFKFNNKIFLKNRIFRVNKIDYKPNDLATVEFILIP